MAFDVKEALGKGYTSDQIADYLGSVTGFDVKAAKEKGYTSDQISQYLATVDAAPQAPVKPEKPTGLISGLVQSIGSGAATTGRSVAATGAGVVGANQTIEGLADSQNKAQVDQPAELKKIKQDLASEQQRLGPDAGFWDSVRSIGSTLLSNPKGAAFMVAEQLPNAAATLGAGAAGAAALAPLGPVAAGAGFLGGMFLGNTSVEAGGKLIEKAEGGLTDEERVEGLKEGAIKGGVITAVDAATFKLGGALTKSLNKTAINAGARAEAKVLADAGVDVADKAAIETALRTAPDLRTAAQKAGQEAAGAAMTIGQRVATATGALTMETLGEGLGEFAGEFAATGKADIYNAVLESFTSLGQSSFETGYNLFQSQGNRLDAANIVDQSRVRAEQALQGATSAGEAVAAANAIVNPESERGLIAAAAGLNSSLDAFSAPVADTPAAPDFEARRKAAAQMVQQEMLVNQTPAGTIPTKETVSEQVKLDQMREEMAPEQQTEPRIVEANLDLLAGRQRLAARQAEGQDVMLVPAGEGRVSIAQRPAQTQAAPAATPDITQAQANAQLEASALGAPRVDPEEQARQGLITRTMQAVEARGGVASPEEEQTLRQANMGARIDRVDPALGRQLSTDETLTQATGIEVGAPAGLGFGARTSERQTITAPFTPTQSLQGQKTAQQQTPSMDAAAVDSRLVAAEVQRMRETNTPAAQAFVAAYERGDISDADVLAKAVPKAQSNVSPGGIVIKASMQRQGNTLVNTNADGTTETFELINPDQLGNQTTTKDGKQTLSQGQYKVIAALARIFGRKVQAYRGQGADGFVIDGENSTIYLNANSGISSMNVLFHEMLHTIKKQVPVAYGALSKVVLKQLGEAGKKQFAVYYNGGDPKAEWNDSMTEEAVADAFGKLLSQPGFLGEILQEITAQQAEKAPAIIARFLAALNKAIDAALATIRAPEFTMFVGNTEAELLELKAAVKEAMREYSANGGLDAVKLQGMTIREMSKLELAPARDATNAGTFPNELAARQAMAARGERDFTVEPSGSGVVVRRNVGPRQPEGFVPDQVARYSSERGQEIKQSRANRGGVKEELGGFTIRNQKDGTLGVAGDPEKIKAALPPDVGGRVIPGGMVFTNSEAPRVKAALEGRDVAYSRAGQVIEKLPMRNGVYLGAPDKYNTPAKITSLRNQLRKLTVEGTRGRFWYENSSKAVLDMVGGNVQEARKFVALLAIYSPQAKVDANSTFALRAWAQYKAGQPISVKTSVMDNKANEAMADVDKFWSGQKTGNFFYNLLRMIDPSTADKQGATIDMWMMRAGEYSSDAPTSTQYAFMENEVNRIAKEMGWEPQQVQAAIWVAMKARMENDGVKKRTEKISEKKGWIRYDYPLKKGRPVKTRVVVDAQQHRDNWLKQALAHTPTKEDTEKAKFDFSDGVRRHIGQLSWEARPGRSTSVLPGIHNASYEKQVEFQQAVQKALLDDNGIDLLAYKVGLLIDGPDILAPGIWQGDVAAGMQKRIAMPPAKGADGKTSIDPAQKQALEVYASVLGLLLRQEGVGYHRPFYKGRKSDENGVQVDIGRTFTQDEAQSLWAAIDSRMKQLGIPGWEEDAGLISAPNGMRVVNFGAIEDNETFRNLVKDAAGTLAVSQVKIGAFSTDGDLITNNWKDNPNGESYRSRIVTGGSPDLLRWTGTVLAPRIQSVFDEFSAKYGWGNSGTVYDASDLPAEDASGQDVKKSTQRAAQRVKEYAEEFRGSFFETPAIFETDILKIAQQLGLSIERDDDIEPTAREVYKIQLPKVKLESGEVKQSFALVMRRVNKQTGRDEVQINVGDLESGMRGDQIYQLAGAYAFNNGLVFSYDEDGISPAGELRRVENLLMLGLKYGSFDWLDVHPQMIGKNGLQWDFNWDSDQKLEALLKSSNMATRKLVPEVKDVIFEETTAEFRSRSTGAVVSRNDFVAMANRARRNASPANKNGMPGDRTLRLTSIFNSIAARLPATIAEPIRERLVRDPNGTALLRNLTRDIRRSTARSPLGFYSALTKGIEGVSANAAPAAGWKDAMKGLVNKGLAKADEIEWSGVTDWLDLQTGKVTKEQVLDYLRNNGVQVEETVLGARKPKAPEYTAKDRLGIAQTAISINYFEERTDGYITVNRRQMSDADLFEALEAGAVTPGELDQELAPLAQDYVNAYLEYERIGDMDDVSDDDDYSYTNTKYGPYTLPGGENYREVLLTLTEKEPSFIVDDFIARMSEKYGRDAIFDTQGTASTVKREFPAMLSPEDQNAYYRAVDAGKKADAGTQFQSSHWDHSDVLAHLRVNDRVDTDGNKVLFVEEMQSDWGQQGREQGFQPPETKRVTGTVEPAGPGRWMVEWEDGGLTFYYDEATARAKAAEGIDIEIPGVPTAPFVTKTDGWLNLLLKRAITMAVQGGYDKVAFTNGDQNVDRYSSALTDRVDLLTRSKTFQGHAITAYKNDQMVITEVVADEKEAAALVGKEIAQRLFADQDQETLTEVKGQGLKIGGEGMRRFYDQIVPQAINKLVKKFDSKTEQVTLEYDPNPELDKWEPEDGTGDGSKAPVQMYRQTGFAVTDKMREIVAKEGLPLFSRQRRLFTDVEPVVNEFGQLLAPNGRKSNLTEEQWYQVRSPEFKAWFGDWEKDPANASRVVDANGEPMVVYHGTDKGGFAVFNTPGGARRGDIAIFATDNRDMADSYVRRGRASRDVTLPAKYTLEDFQARGYVAERTEDGWWDLYDYNSGDVIAQADTLAELIDSDDAQNTLAEMGGGSEYGIYPVFVNLRDALTVDAEGNLWNEVPEYGSTDTVGRQAYAMDMDGAIVENVIDDGGGASAYDESPSTIYMVFDPSNIKSANSNVGSFDPANPDIRRSTARFTPPSTKTMDDVIYKLQDKNIDLRRVTQAIVKANGAIDDEVNAYQREELYHGRAAKQSQDFLNRELTPLLESIRQNKVALKDFETYLWNRHAEERNVQIAKVNDRFPDGGSGIKTADARAYLANLSPEQRAVYERLAQRVDAITKQNMQMMVDTGLETQDTIDAMRGAYKAYVPLLRGESSSYTGRGQGYSIKGATTKRALGSDKPVENILSALADQREKIISRAEKARVGRALMGLALENPNEDFWFVFDPLLNRDESQRTELRNQLESLGLDPDLAEEIGQQPYEEYMGPNGKVARRPNRKLTQVPNAIAVRINGEDKFVVLNQEDPRAARMAEALSNLDAPQLDGAMGILGKISRYFASINTQYNPIFGIVNALRDTQGAMLNLSSTGLAGKQADVAAGVPAAIAAIYKSARATRNGGSVAGEWADLYQRFLNQGAQTGYRDMYESPKDRTEKQIRAELTPNAFEQAWKKSAGPVFNWLSDYNETMENAVRLSAFKVALDNGMTDEQAASLAKNLTVNFNRKGQIGVQAGALYAFYNASTQGTARLLETLNGPAGRKIMAGGVLLGVAQTIMLAMAGFDDEEPPEFVRERNLIIPVGNGKYLTLPMPLGPHVLPNLGRIVAEQVMGRTDKSVASSMASLFGTIVDAFNPVGSGSLLQTFSPTVLDPAVALAENKDFTGKPIARADFNESKPTPGYTRARDNSMSVLTAISKTLNYLSGGSDYTKGVVSPTPDQLEYVIGQVTGGVGRELSKIVQVAETTTTGEELPSYKVPLLGRFAGDTREQSSQGGQFYANLRSMNDHKLEIEGRAKNREDVAGYLRDNPDARLFKAAERVEQRVQDLRKMKRQLIEREGSPERVRQIDDAITRVMKGFNEQVRASKGRELVAN